MAQPENSELRKSVAHGPRPELISTNFHTIHERTSWMPSFDLTQWFSERPLLICFVFGGLSILATLHNKFVFSRQIVGSSNVLLLIQSIVTIVALRVLRRFKVLDFEVNMRSTGDWLCGLAATMSVVCGLWSLFFVNVVMFGALKRLTSLVSWAIEYKFTPSETTMKCLPPLILMFVGTMQAAFYDFQFSLVGYVLAGLSCVAQGSSFELGRRVARRNKGVCAVLYSNSVIALPVLLVIVLLTGDLSIALMDVFGASYAPQLAETAITAADLSSAPLAGATNAPSTSSSTYTYTPLETFFHISANCFTCQLMNYFIFLNCFVNSPLAHSVTGNMKVVMTTLIGGIMFGFSLDSWGIIGLVSTLLSGLWFSAVKLRARQDTKRHANVVAAAEEPTLKSTSSIVVMPSPTDTVALSCNAERAVDEKPLCEKLEGGADRVVCQK